MNYLNRDIELNPVANFLSHRRELDWCLRVLENICKELPSREPRERVFVLRRLTLGDFEMSPEGRIDLYDLMQAVTYLQQQGMAERGHQWLSDNGVTFKCADGYEDALTVFEWKLDEARKAASERATA